MLPPCVRFAVLSTEALALKPIKVGKHFGKFAPPLRLAKGAAPFLLAAFTSECVINLLVEYCVPQFLEECVHAGCLAW